MPKYNPFRPGSIVAPGMFSGRLDELKVLEKCLSQTKLGNPQHFLLRGERGIGKSSLCFYAQSLAEGSIDSLDEKRFHFIPVCIELEPASDYFQIAKKLARELQRSVGALSRVKEVAKDVWSFITRWEAMGVKYKGKDEPRTADRDQVLEELSDAIQKVVTATGNSHDGVLILIDEADKPPSSADLGELLKLLTERLAKRGCSKVAIGLAGLPSVLEKLRKSHESSPRLFEILTLEPLLGGERFSVIERGLQDAEKKNEFRTTITTEAQEWIATYSEGYPHFIQQFSYSAFEADTDNNIDAADVRRGASTENGALAQLGLKYFEEVYFDQINSDEYREVLKYMASHGDGWVERDKIAEATKLKPSTLSNAVGALKRRNIIIPQKGRTGLYRLPTKSFAVWINAFVLGVEVPMVGPPLPPDYEEKAR